MSVTPRRRGLLPVRLTSWLSPTSLRLAPGLAHFALDFYRDPTDENFISGADHFCGRNGCRRPRRQARRSVWCGARTVIGTSRVRINREPPARSGPYFCRAAARGSIIRRPAAQRAPKRRPLRLRVLRRYRSSSWWYRRAGPTYATIPPILVAVIVDEASVVDAGDAVDD